jgi:hypothetical protein
MKRRGNGEGSIFQRKNGRWEAHVSVTQLNGLSKRVCVSATSYDAIKAKVKKILESGNQELFHIKKDWTVSEYFDYWIKEVQQEKIRETTMAAYKLLIKNHIKPTLGYHKLQSLSAQHVRCALNQMKNNGCSGAVRQKYYIVLTACLNCAMREEILSRNVAKLVDKPEYKSKETMIWTEKQAMHFLQTAKDHPQFIAFLLLLSYGLRRGEALGLR